MAIRRNFCAVQSHIRPPVPMREAVLKNRFHAGVICVPKNNVNISIGDEVL